MNKAIKLSLNSVGFQYSNASEKVLDALNMEVNTGEWVTVLGANGSGKSTLLKIIGALLIPTQGFCFIDGINSADREQIEQIRHRIGYVFQNPDNQIVASTVENDVAFAPENMGIDSIEIRNRVAYALEITGLTDMRTRDISTLSGGEKQRLAVAGVLAMKPDLLLLDEPTSMLDPVSRNTLIETIRKINENGTTVIYTTHKIEEMKYSDKVIIMSDGKVVHSGSTYDFLHSSLLKLKNTTFRIPSIIKLKQKLVEEQIITPDTSLDVETMEDKICQYMQNT